MRIPLLCLGIVVASSAPAFTFDFSGGFADTSNLVANQNYGYGSIFANNRLRLTDGGDSQAGSVWYASAVPIATFSTRFQFRMHSGSSPRADGMTFTIQGMGVNALGPAGGGLGYGPDNSSGSGGIDRSMAIKFDNYSNQGEGTSSTGVYYNGAAPTSANSIDLQGTGIDFQSDDAFEVEIFYDGLSLDVTIMNMRTWDVAGQSYNLDLLGTIGSDMAYVGFTAGTGGLQQITEISTWTYDGAEYVDGAVPEPATLTAMALGAAALLRRRRS